jgi:hypothetical protein
MMSASATLRQARSGARAWFYKPEWYWHGPRTLWPFRYGHDEYARRTFLFGWTITGRVVIALWDCGVPECLAYAEDDLKYEGTKTNG